MPAEFKARTTGLGNSPAMGRPAAKSPWQRGGAHQQKLAAQPGRNASPVHFARRAGAGVPFSPLND